VQQRDPPARSNQIDRHAVGDGHHEEDSRRGGDPTVNSLDLDPACPAIDPQDLDAVDLIPQDHSREFEHASPKGEPTAHHLPDRLLAPKTEIEATALRGATPGYAGDNAEPFLPAGNFESGNGTGDGCFAELG
jgi:hypothetical protein